MNTFAQPSRTPAGVRSRVKQVAVLGIIVAAAASLTGCNNAASGGLSGAGLGAGAGAIIGSLYGHAGTGAAIGAVAGGLSGAVIGDQNERRDRSPSYTTYSAPAYYTAPSYSEVRYYDYYCPPRTTVYYYNTHRHGHCR